MNSRVCSIRVSSVATLIPLLTLAVMAPSAPAQVKGVVIVISTPNPVVLAGPATFTAGVNWTTSAVPSGTTIRIGPDPSVWVSVTLSRRARGEKPPAIATALSTLILGT